MSYSMQYITIFALFISNVLANDIPHDVVNIVNDITHIWVNAANDQEYHLIDKHFDENVKACLCGVCYDTKDQFKVGITQYFDQLNHPYLTEVPSHMTVNTQYFSFSYESFFSKHEGGALHTNGQVWGEFNGNGHVIEYHKECVYSQDIQLKSIFAHINLDPINRLRNSFKLFSTHQYKEFSNSFAEDGVFTVPGLFTAKGPKNIYTAIENLITRYGLFDMNHLMFTQTDKLAGGSGVAHWSVVLKPNYHKESHYVEVPAVMTEDSEGNKEDAFPNLESQRLNKLIIKNDHCVVLVKGFSLLSLNEYDGLFKEMVLMWDADVTEHSFEGCYSLNPELLEL